MLHQFFRYLLRNQVLFALFLFATAWTVVALREIIVSIFLAYILMAAVLPIVESLRKRGWPKILAVLVPYLTIIISIFLLIVPLVPFVVSQIQSLAVNFPRFIDSSADSLGVSMDPGQLRTYANSQVNNLGKSAVNVTTQVFGGLFSVITIFVVSFYLLMYNDSFKKGLAKLFHKNDREYVHEALSHINDKLGAWMRGQILLSLFIGLLSWMGLTILGIPYALPLALLAGMLEVLPTIGPIISAVPAVIIALTVSPTMALAVVGLYVLIQALENQVLVPKVMQKAVGLNPVIVILSIMIGTKLMGIAGALLAVPFLSLLIVVAKTLEERNQ